MRIHYHSDCPFFAGSEKMLVNLWADAALRQAHRISFSTRRNPEYINGLRAHLVPDFPVIALRLPPLHWPVRDLPGKLALISRAIRMAFRVVTELPFLLYEAAVLTRVLRRIRPDIVHVNNGGYPAARSARAAVIAGRLAGAKGTLMVVNNMAVSYTRPSRWPDLPGDRLVVRAVDRFVTGSLAAARQLASVLGLSNGAVQPIHNGIKLRAVATPPTEVRGACGVPPDFRGAVFGVVALMEPRKGHAVLLDAMDELLRRHPAVRDRLVLLLEGVGPVRPQLEQTVRERKLGDVVRFVGRQANIADFMNALDVLVLPSIGFEDFPNVTLEAMGFGKAVVATRIAGIPEQVVHDETGLLVPPGDAQALSRAIETFVERPELAGDFGRRGRDRFIKEFTAEVAVERYMNLYADMGASAR